MPDPRMEDQVTIGELLDALSAELTGPGVPPARGVARDLIAGVLDRPRFWPSGHRNDVLSPEVEQQIREAARRLKTGMPIQYAIGKANFRHLTLKVDSRVLIPRPETEMLVDIVLSNGAQRTGVTAGSGRDARADVSAATVVDVGTGSGAVALSLAAEGRFDRVIGTDISADALEVARRNLEVLPEDRRDRVTFLQGSLLVPLGGERVGTVVSNPPYISTAESAELPALVRDWEPHLALFAEEGGMWAIRELVPQAADHLVAGGLLAMEVDSRRATIAADEVSNSGHFSDVQIRHDLTGRPRFVVARRKEL